jgi:hypothetical protein
MAITMDAVRTGAAVMAFAFVVTGAISGCGAPASQPAPHPDPNYRRQCAATDFGCTDWACRDTLVDGECYKPCTPASPAAIGGADDECDEPARPFCGQVGVSYGGDYNCNGCQFVCQSKEGVRTCPLDNAC